MKKRSKQPVFILVAAALLVVAIAGYMAFQEYSVHRFPPGYRNRPASGWGTRAGEDEFSKANDKIDSLGETNALGNSPAAIALAAQFSQTFKSARDKLFTEAFPIEVLESTKGEFLTYCELHEDECAFIVHVPGLRHFEKDFTQKVDARKALAQAGWLSAQQVLQSSHAGKPHMELAVGLRGISQYGPIMLGYYTDNAKDPNDGLIKYLDDSTDDNFLWSFFAAPVKK